MKRRGKQGWVQGEAELWGYLTSHGQIVGSFGAHTAGQSGPVSWRNGWALCS